MCDIPQSPDGAIQHLVKRYQELRENFERLELHVREYGARLPAPVMTTRQAISLQEHYNMLDHEDCGCVICMEWAQRREEFLRAIKSIPAGHKWSVCPCRQSQV